MIAIGESHFLNAVSEGMKISKKNGLYGIVEKETDKEILPVLYDYLRPHGAAIGVFILRRNGRWNCLDMDCSFQEVQIDLKVTKRDGNRTVEELYPISNERFSQNNTARLNELVY